MSKHTALYVKAIKFQNKKYGPINESMVLEMALAMERALPDRAAFVYAYCKTGLIIVQNEDGSTNADWRPKKDILEYNAAIKEFKTLTK